MALPFGVETTGEEVCPLHRCHWPVGSFAWTSVGRPGGYKNIVCEELNAQCWSLEERLKRPSEHNCRILHGCDSASGTGALLKGRSPSRMVNRYCKQIAALCLGGGFITFISWIPTKENPADDPSSWHGVRSKGAPRQPIAKSEVMSHVRIDRPVAVSTRPVVLHLCSGPRRAGDFSRTCFGLVLSVQHRLGGYFY